MTSKIESDSSLCCSMAKKYYKDSKCRNHKYMQIRNILLPRSNVTSMRKSTKKTIQEGHPKEWEMIGSDRTCLRLEKPVKDAWMLTTQARRDSYHLNEEKEIMRNICTLRFWKIRWGKVHTTGSITNPTLISSPFSHSHRHHPRKNRYTNLTATAITTTKTAIKIYRRIEVMEISTKNHIIILITMNRGINLVTMIILIKAGKATGMLKINLNLLQWEILINIKARNQPPWTIIWNTKTGIKLLIEVLTMARRRSTSLRNMISMSGKLPSKILKLHHPATRNNRGKIIKGNLAAVLQSPPFAAKTTNISDNDSLFFTF